MYMSCLHQHVLFKKTTCTCNIPKKTTCTCTCHVMFTRGQHVHVLFKKTTCTCNVYIYMYMFMLTSYDGFVISRNSGSDIQGHITCITYNVHVHVPQMC